MIRSFRVVRYRFRVTFARRWGGLLAIVLVVGLVGALAIGAIAGARRTQSSFPAYLARINARDLAVLSAIDAPGAGNTPYDAGVVKTIARLPHVKQVADFTIVDPNITPLVKLDIHLAPGQAPPTIGGSFDGAYSTIDRVTLASGRLADPQRTNEVVMDAGAARELGMHVGSVLPVGFYTNAQQLPGLQPTPGTKLPPPHLKVDLKLVGIVVFHTQVIEDDVDALSDNWVLLTPRLIHELVPCCAFVTETSIGVEGGYHNVAAVESEITRAFPKQGGGGGGVRTSVEVSKAERAVEPESIALGVFGAIAALAALLIGGLLIAGHLRSGRDERVVLRALGASPATTVGDGLFGVVGAVMLGALLATAAAVGLSALAPLGPVRRVEHAGIAFDWTVLGIGCVGLTVLLSAAAAVIATRQAPRRVTRRQRAGESRAARAAGNLGLPAPTVTGIRFALDSGAGTTNVPVRSAILGAVLAIVVVTSTVTFGNSLRTLVSHPRLYGWNWNYELLSGFSGQEDLPQKQVATLLDHDPYVAAWTGIYLQGTRIDGQDVPTIATGPNAPVAPPLLSGHGFNAPDQVVLGATTLAALHKHVGDTVQVQTGPKQPTILHIAGTATFPAIGKGTTMGTGALLSDRLFSANQLNQQNSAIPGPQAILIRIRKTANPGAALRSLQRINNTLSRGPDGPTSGVANVLRPAEIVNYQSTGTTPALLGVALAVGATTALALTLIASVRRRRRELALLKTLGFTRRQLAAVVAWQSTIAVAVGVVIGIPVGVVLGRSLWDLFAHAIHAVPDPTVPALTVTLIAFGALVLANLVAAIPGLQAARTPSALLLHDE